MKKIIKKAKPKIKPQIKAKPKTKAKTVSKTKAIIDIDQTLLDSFKAFLMTKDSVNAIAFPNIFLVKEGGCLIASKFARGMRRDKAGMCRDKAVEFDGWLEEQPPVLIKKLMSEYKKLYKNIAVGMKKSKTVLVKNLAIFHRIVKPARIVKDIQTGKNAKLPAREIVLVYPDPNFLNIIEVEYVFSSQELAALEIDPVLERFFYKAFP